MEFLIDTDTYTLMVLVLTLVVTAMVKAVIKAWMFFKVTKLSSVLNKF